MQVLRPNVRLGYLDVAIVKNSQNSRHAICHIFATMFCGSETCKQWSQKYLVSESRGVIVLVLRVPDRDSNSCRSTFVLCAENGTRFDVIKIENAFLKEAESQFFVSFDLLLAPEIEVLRLSELAYAG